MQCIVTIESTTWLDANDRAAIRTPAVGAVGAARRLAFEKFVDGVPKRRVDVVSDDSARVKDNRQRYTARLPP